MSKSAKTRQSEFRKKAKRAEKERQHSLYQSFRDAGTNKKSKRNRNKSKQTIKVGAVSHPDGSCGNLACQRDFPELNDPFNALPGSCIYANQFKPNSSGFKRHMAD